MEVCVIAAHKGCYPFVNNNHNMRGITLIELSIVIVVISLLLIGVLIGNSLRKIAMLHSISSDMMRYTAAVNTFMLKYDYLPGDLPSATTYWGVDPGGCPLTTPNSVPKRETCNGDGNGLIADFPLDDTPDIATAYEAYRAWQHLSNAELVTGIYTGVAAACSIIGSTTGLNVPKSRYPNSGYNLYKHKNDGSSVLSWAGRWGHIYEFGSDQGCSGNSYPTMSPQDAYILDSKFDDGKPHTGMFLATRLVGCVTDTDPNNNPRYEMSNETDPNCNFAFRLGI